jgi:hypothetical protein
MQQNYFRVENRKNKQLNFLLTHLSNVSDNVRSYSQLKIVYNYPNPQGKNPNWKLQNKKYWITNSKIFENKGLFTNMKLGKANERGSQLK